MKTTWKEVCTLSIFFSCDFSSGKNFWSLRNAYMMNLAADIPFSLFPFAINRFNLCPRARSFWISFFLVRRDGCRHRFALGSRLVEFEVGVFDWFSAFISSDIFFTL